MVSVPLGAVMPPWCPSTKLECEGGRTRVPYSVRALVSCPPGDAVGGVFGDRIVVRQLGHERELWSHCSRHSEWKKWLQGCVASTWASGRYYNVMVSLLVDTRLMNLHHRDILGIGSHSPD